MVFGAIRRFDDTFLLLKLLLDTPSLSHSSGKCQRSEHEVAGYIAEPPGNPNRAVVPPVGKPVQRKAGHAEHRADDRTDRCGEREFENALWPIKNILAAREAVHQPCADYSLKC